MGAVGAVVNAGITAITTYKTTGRVNVGKVIVAAVIGGVSGALSGTGISLGWNMYANATLNLLQYTANATLDNEDINDKAALFAVTAGAVSGYIGGSGVGDEVAEQSISTVLRNPQLKSTVAKHAITTVKAAIPSNIEDGVKILTAGTQPSFHYDFPMEYIPGVSNLQ